MAERLDILVTGGAGQVGQELQSIAWPDHIRLHAPDRSELDLSEAASVKRMFESRSYSAVINPAAWTTVDKAETDVAGAFAANAMGPAHLADATREAGIPLIHVSTDYVFDGSKTTPYTEADLVAPLGVYGASKLAGEVAVRTGNRRSIVLRTAWVLSIHRANFLKTMLRVAGEREEVRVVADQFGCPTSARDIAWALRAITLRMIEDPEAPTGVYHFVNAGETSWAGLATEIFNRSGEAGGPVARVAYIPTSEYPTPARRPANSRMATDRLARDYGIEPRHWQVAVAEIVAELNTGRGQA